MKHKLLIIKMLLIITPFTCYTQQTTMKRKDLQNIIINQYLHHAEMQEITLGKGQKAPLHYHPCPVIGIITLGKVLFQAEGEDPKVLKSGDSFYEPKNIKILHFDNVSQTKPAIFIAIYLKEANEKSIEIYKQN
ncbi:Cupin domain protein [Elizabethkingia miricola]|nr:Cupin domain protein [Elizabethkingia miricola]